MQTTPTSPSETAAVIAKYFENPPEELTNARGDRAWTKQLKKYLVNRGQEYGWDTCPDWDAKGCLKGGWLYDLIWYKEDAAGHTSEIYLVMESEWGRGWGPIKYDFEKLLLAKSTLKLMIFQADDREISELFRLLETGIRAFSKLQCADEIYMLVAYNLDTDKFVIRQHNGMGDLLVKRTVNVQ